MRPDYLAPGLPVLMAGGWGGGKSTHGWGQVQQSLESLVGADVGHVDGITGRRDQLGPPLSGLTVGETGDMGVRIRVDRSYLDISLGSDGYFFGFSAHGLLLVL